MSIVTDFLDKQEIPYKTVPGGQLILNPCPKCGDSKGKFYVNAENGLHDCKICGHKGNFFKLKSLFGVVEGVMSAQQILGNQFKPLDDSLMVNAEKALAQNANAQEYLRSRGLTDETIKHFRLGYMEDNMGGWIAIPHIQDGKLWNMKYRRFSGGEKTFRRIEGQPTVLYNIDGLSYKKGGVLIAEGEFDVMAAWQMGVPNTVGFTGGAKTFKPEWLKIFAQFNRVYICLDSDKVGQEGARKVAETIGLKKTRNMLLPTKDINDFMIDPNHDAAEFKSILGHATQFEMDYVGTAADIAGQLDDWLSGASTALKGLETGFPQFDKLTHGLKDQDLMILSGDSGVGKTTLCLNIMHNVMKEDHATLGFFLEGQIPYYILRMVAGDMGMKYQDVNKTPEGFEAFKKYVSEMPLYYYKGPQSSLTIEMMKEIIPLAVRLYDVKLIVIDNLQKLVRGDDNMVYQRFSNAVSILKDLAVDNNVPIILISHITKRDDTKSRITMHDVKGSSTIYQDADIFAIFQKIKDDYYISLDKNRMGEGEIHIPVNANKETGKFEEKNQDAIPTSNLGKIPRTQSSE